MRKTRTAVCGILAAIFALAFIACTTGGHDHGPITWTATANNTTHTTAINFSFNDSVSGLSASNITIADGTGSATMGALTGSGPSRSLTITVLSPGTVYVSINRSGIATGPQTVTIFAPAPIAWTAIPAGSPNITALYFSFSGSVSGLSASDITIADGTGSVTRGALTGSGASRSLAITVLNHGTVHVSINRAGIATGPQAVTLEGLPILTGTVSITGIPEVGQTLTANTDNLGGSGDISFQWRRGTTDIGTGNSTYVVQDADVGSIITVTVTRADNSGNVTSSPIAIGAILVPVGVTLAEQLSWIRGFGQIDNHYIVQISGNENISPANAALPIGRNNTITIRGKEAVREVRLSVNGVLFTIGSGVTLVLDENVALVGRGGVGSHVTAAGANNNHLVRINSGGTLIMNEGARIVGNAFAATITWGGNVTSQGGGVHIANGGTFTMNGGEISGNRATTTIAISVAAGTGTALSQGGGVFVANGGAFTMNDGVISGNQATAARNGGTGGNITARGGGVYVISGGTFTMNGGEVSGNVATATRPTGSGGNIVPQGGGVFVAASAGSGGNFVPAGIFRISNGIVRGNETAVATALRNTSGDGLSASLHNAGTAQRGIFSNGAFTSLGTLSTTNITINVLNGNLQW